MGDHVGRFEFTEGGQRGATSGACRLSWDDARLTVVPDDAPPLTADFGDIDRFVAGDYEITLVIHPGDTLRFLRLGPAYEVIAREMLEAHRSRLVRCLLLGDLPELARYEGTAAVAGPEPLAQGPAQLRLFESNLAVLPAAGGGLHWRLSEVDHLEFSSVEFAWTLTSGNRRLVVSRLAKRTTEFGQKVGEARARVGERSAKALAGVFPWLNAAALGGLADTWREGRLVSARSLGNIDARLATALIDRAVRPEERPYIDALFGSNRTEPWWAGYRLLRPDEVAGPEVGEAAAASDFRAMDGDDGAAPAAPAGGDDTPLVPLFWFFVPVRTRPGRTTPDLVAWEATSAGSRATYVFRADAGLDALNAGLVALNFRREPIYLPDDRLASESRLRHYAIAARRLPDLRAVRRAFVGRAIHASPEAWERQLDQIVQSAI